VYLCNESPNGKHIYKRKLLEAVRALGGIPQGLDLTTAEQRLRDSGPISSDFSDLLVPKAVEMGGGGKTHARRMLLGGCLIPIEDLKRKSLEDETDPNRMVGRELRNHLRIRGLNVSGLVAECRTFNLVELLTQCCLVQARG
jgi:hypothetical protein